MATRRYSLAPGQSEYQVTEAVGAAVVTSPIELTVDLAAITGLGTRAPNKAEIIEVLDEFKNYILRGNWPPA